MTSSYDEYHVFVLELYIFKSMLLSLHDYSSFGMWYRNWRRGHSNLIFGSGKDLDNSFLRDFFKYSITLAMPDSCL